MLILFIVLLLKMEENFLLLIFLLLKSMDMLDLHYRYHWATEEKRLRPETEIKDLNPDVLMERRRGLEWLISEESDWFDISMDT